MDFTNLLPVSKTRLSSPGNPIPIIRDTLTLPTWLCIGAALQSLAFLTIGRLAFLPATTLLAYRIIEAYLIAVGVKQNPHMEDVILGKYSAQFPDAQGEYGREAGRSEVAVLLIGTQSNHPLGLLAPGFKEMGAHMTKMVQELENNAVEHGFLGSNSYMGTKRTSNNTLMNVMYFRHADDVHAFATGSLHREALNWWNKTVAQYPHLGIYHELYHVPKGQWESVYAQCKPMGVADTLHYTNNKISADGSEDRGVWMSPVVDARKGVLKNSAGRMGKVG